MPTINRWRYLICTRLTSRHARLTLENAGGLNPAEGSRTMANKMSIEDKEQLCELLDDFMWEYEDADLSMQIIQLISRIKEEI